MSMGSWDMPEDRPAVDVRSQRVATEVEDTSEEEDIDISDLILWLSSKPKDDFVPDFRMSVTLDNMVRGLIYGGRYLYGWNNGAGGDAPLGMGMPELEPLQDCTIVCGVSRRKQFGKRGEVHVALNTPPAILFSGYEEDADVHDTRKPVSIGPRRVGPPADIVLKVGPSWVMMSPREREAHLFDKLCRIGRAVGESVREWGVGGADIEINQATISVYGSETIEGRTAIAGSRGHVTATIDDLTGEERKQLFLMLAREYNVDERRS